LTDKLKIAGISGSFALYTFSVELSAWSGSKCYACPP